MSSFSEAFSSAIFGRANVSATSASLGSEASKALSLVAKTRTWYTVPPFKRWMVNELPVAPVVAFDHFTPSVEYCTVYFWAGVMVFLP